MNKKSLVLILITGIITIIFFTYKPIITYDSSHYLWLSSLLTNVQNFSNWDVARGIVFPLMIAISKLIGGANSNALLIMMYIFYLVMIFISYKIYKKVVQTNSKLIKIILIGLFTITIGLNPMIFGYYHTLLTEFVAITMGLLGCYLSWKMLYIDFGKSKKYYIIYTVILAILSAFMWQIKQPYVGTIIFPLIVVTIISICKFHNLKNILVRIATVFISVAFIVLSIVIWNYILKIGNVNIQKNRTSSGFFSTQLISGITKYKNNNNTDKYTKEFIETDAFIENNEKKEMYKIIDGNSEKYKNFIVLEECDENFNMFSKKVLFIANENISMQEAMKYVLSSTIDEPSSVFGSYFNNYLTMADIYELEMINNVFYINNKEIYYNTISENGMIGYRMYIYGNTNYFPLAEKYQVYAKDYIETEKPIVCFNYAMKILQKIDTPLYKITILILPILIVYTIVKLIFFTKKYKENYVKALELICILLIFSFIHIMCHVILGSIIDRYAMPTVATMFMAIIIYIYLILDRKNLKLK